MFEYIIQKFRSFINNIINLNMQIFSFDDNLFRGNDFLQPLPKGGPAAGCFRVDFVWFVSPDFVGGYSY